MSPCPTLGKVESPLKTTSAKLSLAMIVKDEALTIQRVLECARLVCDELIVVDTGSTDETPELARAMGARVVQFEWVDDFAAARNHAFEHCGGDWIVWLDADDILSESAQRQILALKRPAQRRHRRRLCHLPDQFFRRGRLFV